jgi:hypothetical protein
MLSEALDLAKPVASAFHAWAVEEQRSDLTGASIETLDEAYEQVVTTIEELLALLAPFKREGT